MPTPMSDKKIPRYRAIADGLINAIVARQYPVGSSLPAETELCEQLQASRHTIREALRILEEAGLISRRQGSGSEVVADTPPVRYSQSVDSIEDLLQYGNQSRLQLLATREVAASDEVARDMGCAEGTPCIELKGLRCERGPAAHVTTPGPAASGNSATPKPVPGRPFALTTIWLPAQPAKRRDKLLKAETALSVMLASLDASTLGRIEQSFTAVALDAEAAALLQTKKGAPALRADRRYFDRDGNLILVARSWHRGDLFRYSTVLRHEAA